MLYRLFARPLLFRLAPETAHRLGLGLLRLLGHLLWLCRWLRSRALRSGEAELPGLEVQLAGLTFSHPVCLAAGLDKDAEAVDGLFALGFAAVEVGTLTPRAQSGNPLPRLFRLPAHEALINRMGFNNHGVPQAAARLQDRRWSPGPLGVNVGKNKETPLESAVSDYLACIDALALLSDYVVVNPSSPNTPGLRQLQEPKALSLLLTSARHRLDALAPGKPLFLKIAPDLEPEAIDAAVDVAVEARIDGIIATNTTIARPIADPLSAEVGGLSGRPLADASTEVIRRIYARTEGQLPVIGVGGIFDADDAYAKLRAGASLVQLYTGFIYRGPEAIPEILRGLRQRMVQDGFSAIAQVTGADHRSTPANL